MATNYAKFVSTKTTPQNRPIPGEAQVLNNAGGYVYSLDKWAQLKRFLVIGCANGSYYAGKAKMTGDNTKVLNECLIEDARRTINNIVDVSVEGKAPKNDEAIFALAVAASHKNDAVRKLALAELDKVCRIGTHLFQFVEQTNELRGWGRGLRQAIQNWYSSKELSSVAYQVAKYQSREKWSHRDLFRLTHPKFENRSWQALAKWVVKGWDRIPAESTVKDLQLLVAFERAKKATNVKEIVSLIREHNLPRECIPTQWLDNVNVWEALLQKMPMTALIRNLATMTRLGLLAPLSAGTKLVQEKLGDGGYLRRSRIHPIGVLAALKTYQSGRGEKGNNTWTPVQSIVDSLDDAFYLCFEHVEPTNANWCLGLDISGSMWTNLSKTMKGFDAATLAAAMAMALVRVEPHHFIGAFTSRFEEVDISKKDRLDTVLKKMEVLSHRMGGTDCAVPMQHALRNKMDVDAFAVYTDNETWAGNEHPIQALNKYRKGMNKPAKLLVAGMTATGSSIGDPNDKNILDVVGFSTDTPSLMNGFVRGDF